MNGHDYKTTFAELRRGIRSLYLRDGLARIVVLAGAWCLAGFALDYFLHLPWVLRALSLAGFLAALVYAYRVYLAYPMSRRLADDDLALALETTHPRLADRLISTVQLERSLDALEFDESRDMARALIDETRREVTYLDPAAVLAPQATNRRTLAAAVLAGALLLCALVLPGLLSTWARRNLLLTNTAWPQRVYLELRHPVDPGDPERDEFLRAQGSDVPVEVFALEKGDNPSAVWIHYTAASLGSERTLRQGMASNSAEPRLYSFIFHNLRETVEFHVTGGDGRTRHVRIVVQEAPAVIAPKVRLEFPAYTRLAPIEQAGGDVRAPVGTRVLFSAATNKPVKLGRLIVDSRGAEGGKIIDKLAVDPTGMQISGQLEVTASTTYTIELVSDEGMTNDRAAVYQIVARPDTAPRVRVTSPGRSLQATEIASIGFLGHVTDDFGVAGVDFLWTDARGFAEALSGTDGAPQPAVDPAATGSGVAAAPADPAAAKPTLVKLTLPYVDTTALPEDADRPLTALEARPGSADIGFRHQLDLRELRVQDGAGQGSGGKPRPLAAGDRILYRFAATDIGPGQVGVSPDYEITIVNLNHLDRELTQQIKDIQERLRRMRNDADKLDAELGEVAGADGADVKNARLTSLETRQSRLTREARWVEERLGEILETKERNRIATQQEVDNLTSLVRKSGNAAQIADNTEKSVHASVAARNSTERGQQLAESRRGEQALIAALDDLLKDLKEFEDLSTIISSVRDIIHEQEQLRDRARKFGEDPNEKSMPQEPPGEAPGREEQDDR